MTAGAGGLFALFLGLAIIDGRVRSTVAALVTGRIEAPQLAETAGSRVQELAAIMLIAVKDQSLAHLPLVIFSITAVALVILMLRT